MVLFKMRLQTLQNLEGIFNAWFVNVDFLETPGQRAVLLENTPEFLKGRRANATDLAGTEHRLEQVRRIHHTARRRTGTNNGMNLIDKQYGMIFFFEIRQQSFETLLEITPVLGACQQSAQVKGIHHSVGNDIGHLTVNNALGKSLGNRGLADTGLAHEEGVILATTNQNLDDTLDLVFPTNERVDPALTGLFVEICRVAFQRAGATTLFAHFFLGRLIMPFVFSTLDTGNAMGHEVHHVNPGYALLFENIHGLTFLLTEYSDQYIGARYLFLTRGLDMEHSTLQDALKSERWLGLTLTVVTGDQRCC
jgi:hypothetical protein